MSSRIVVAAVVTISLFSPGVTPAVGALLAQQGFGPGQRVMLDAHNAYPQNDRWRDRIDRALSTGLPVAIEQDLFWKKDREGRFEIVVAHDTSELDRAPTLDEYFFQRIRPIMERALAEQRRDTWPLIVLNLDFKQNDAALLDAVYALLGQYESWLTTAPRTSTPDVVAPLSVGPLLVLSGSNEAQRARFHDAVPVGARLRAFGAIPPAVAPGANDDEREANMSRMSAEEIIAPKASNYARWVNFPWLVVEPEGQRNAGDWSAADAARLDALVARAHAQNLWIRFYTLDGFLNGDGDGLTRSYDFGSDAAVKLRWRAAREAGVDFIATDHYERFAQAQSQHPRFRVLVIAERLDPKNAGGNEIHRPYVEAAEHWLARLAADSNFTVSYLESPNTITDSMLSKVDVIWQMNYPPFRWNDTAKAALEKYLDGGRGGWLGDHHASLYGSAVTSETWPWFFDNLLGGINYKNYVSRFAAGTVRVEDAAHPVLRDVPASFRISTEEWYTWDRSPRANVHVLASVDESTYQFVDASQSGIRMGDHPVIWTNDKLRARNLYIFIGHHPNLFDNAAYTTLLTSSIMWLASKPSTPRP